MRESMMIGLVGIMALLGGPTPHRVVAQSSGHDVNLPKACYFFVPEKQNAKELPDELAYGNSVNNVYLLWCTSNQSNSDERRAAADTMVKQWKALWGRDKPFNAEFHETSAIELLYLMGLTHELPAQMAGDPEFTKAWVEACTGSCFTIWSVPGNSTQEHELAMELWLRNDLLDNLKQESASEPVIKMLREAQYRVVN